MHCPAIGKVVGSSPRPNCSQLNFKTLIHAMEEMKSHSDVVFLFDVMLCDVFTNLPNLPISSIPCPGYHPKLNTHACIERLQSFSCYDWAYYIVYCMVASTTGVNRLIQSSILAKYACLSLFIPRAHTVSPPRLLPSSLTSLIVG